MPLGAILGLLVLMSRLVVLFVRLAVSLALWVLACGLCSGLFSFNSVHFSLLAVAAKASCSLLPSVLTMKAWEGMVLGALFPFSWWPGRVFCILLLAELATW